MAVVLVVCCAPVSLLLRVTVALDTAAPLGSSTVPAMSPEVSDCPQAGIAKSAHSNPEKRRESFFAYIQKYSFNFQLGAERPADPDMSFLLVSPGSEDVTFEMNRLYATDGRTSCRGR